MLRMKLILILTIFTLSLKAPSYERLVIVQGEAVRPYDPMLNAFMFVESSYRQNVVNSLGYTGILQIGQAMTDEANRLNIMSGNPVRYSFPTCALDSLQSVQIWYTIMNYHNPSYSLKRAVNVWNPLSSGKYYDKIKAKI